MRKVRNCESPRVHCLKLTLRYHTDPSGTFVRYDAKAIGSGSDAAQQSLQDAFHKVKLSHPCF